ncbi:MAG: hypothetical protein HOP23_18320 [Methylococcaceae bacterium]|nr:hypothetical protein [Methylococcaceae bacterium]
MKYEVEFENIIFRLKSALRISNDKDLCARLGMRASAFSNRRNSNSIPFENIIDLASSENMDLNWVFWGSNNPNSSDDTSYIPIDIEGALIDDILLGNIFRRIEQEFLSNKELIISVGIQKILDYYKDNSEELDGESKENLYALFEEEIERRINEAREKGFAAAHIYNKFIKKKPGNDKKTIKLFIDEEVKSYISFLKLLKNYEDSNL